MSTTVKMPSRFEVWPLTRLKRYARNAKLHPQDQIERIAASMLEFGFNAPILVDSATEEIIAGHGRLSAAEYLKLESAPVMVLDHMTDVQRRAYILADNRLGEGVGWDETMLAEEMRALDAEGFDLDLTGFDDEEIEGLLIGDEDGDEPPGDPESVPPVPKRNVTRRGDLWVLGGHRLICGDSTKLADVERVAPVGSIECMWTDPPYNVAYEGTAGKIQNDDMSDSAFRQFLHDAFMCAFVVMKPGGAAYVAHADTEGLNFRGAFKDAGFKLSSCLIWRKNSLVLGRSDYQWQHEPVLYGWKEGAAHRWYGARNKTTMVEFAGGIFSQIGERQWQIKLGEHTLIVEGDNLLVSEARPSVINVEKPKRNADHPTMKPVDLIVRFLVNSTKTGDEVLDLFGGSGSTMIACEQIGRLARLVELDEKFCDVIVRRWQEYTGKDAYLDGDGQSFNDIAAERLAANDNGEADGAAAA